MNRDARAPLHGQRHFTQGSMNHDQARKPRIPQWTQDPDRARPRFHCSFNPPWRPNPSPCTLRRWAPHHTDPLLIPQLFICPPPRPRHQRCSHSTKREIPRSASSLILYPSPFHLLFLAPHYIQPPRRPPSHSLFSFTISLRRSCLCLSLVLATHVSFICSHH